MGVALDRLAWPDLLGTIAGDDTIFLAVKHRAAQHRVVTELRRLVGGGLGRAAGRQGGRRARRPEGQRAADRWRELPGER